MEGSLPHHFTAQQLHDGNLFHPPHSHPTLVAQHELGLDFQFDPQLENQPDLHLQGRNPFEQAHFDARAPQQRRFHDIRSNAPALTPQDGSFDQGGQYGVLPRTPRQKGDNGGRGGAMFGVLTPHPQLPSQPRPHDEAQERLQNEIDFRPAPITDGGTTEGHFSNMKMIPDPPDLEEWRRRLFDVDDLITLTEDQFQTYFPHVDNIYSHRSTQKYKRKPFVSHYWDCRLKGRPPGTAKSEDPNKRKRKRQARERDLCDVKIKITEYFPDARALMGPEMSVDSSTGTPAVEKFIAPGQPSHDQQPPQPPNILGSNHDTAVGQPGADGARYYTIQRVNGNGANGKGDGTAGGHKHSMEESDKVKKNSIHRHFLKEEKERRKSLKTYHKKATGLALNTVKKHAKEHELKLYGSCFCPFVQRVWISLEVKGLSYQYIEVDPYKKPDSLMRINPRGLIPALEHGDWGCYESSVLMEYLEDLNAGLPLLPQGNPRARAHCRLWSDHINRNILPHFYGLLQAQETNKQVEQATQLKTALASIVEAADPQGPFFLGPHISYVDIQFAPWVIRFRRVLAPFRAWPEPEAGSRWASWVNAIESNEGVKATTSTDDLYEDSYERYAENRPGTSQLANAVNEGRGLP